ncbi:MAG TPA: hypothetical protein VIY48_05990, partial [Candidatus Paceibacterota bacterium]
LLHGQKYLYLTPQITYTKGQSVVKPKAQPKVAQMPLSPKTVARRAAATPAVVKKSNKVRVDLDAPVYPKAGKALWANIKCPVCPAKPFKRCQKSDGSPQEKPHSQRKM